jgi:thymidylate synthase (FAD)
MTKFIAAPSVTTIAKTSMSPDNLMEWATAHDLIEVISDDGTPLGTMWSDLIHDDDQNVSLDALPEFAGRHCYNSFAKGRERDAYLKNVIEMEHGSVLEHSVISLGLSGVSRSLSHELIRHHAGTGVSEASQRYINAENINFIIPPLIKSLTEPFTYDKFSASCLNSLEDYKVLISMMEQETTSIDDDLGLKLATMRKKRILEAARSVLPNAAETRLTWTMNMRAARHVCALRGGIGADLEIRELAVAMTKTLKVEAPIIFSDFEIYTADDGFAAVHCERPKV